MSKGLHSAARRAGIWQLMMLVVLVLAAGFLATGSTRSAGALGGAANPAGHAAAASAVTVTSVSPNHGPGTGGINVTIFGSGFVQGLTTVNFGAEVITSPTFISANQLQVISPGGASTVHVFVVVSGEQSPLSNADLFTFDTPTGPSVVSVSPSSGPVNGGEQLTIGGSGFVFSPSGAVTFVNSTTSSPNSVPCGNSAVTTPNCYSVNTSTIMVMQPTLAPGTYHVTVTITGSGGTTSPIASGAVFTVGTAPVVGAISPNSGPASGIPLTQVTITGANFCPGLTDTSPCPPGSALGLKVWFGTVEATGVNVMNRNTITAYAPPQAPGIVHVQITTGNGGGTGPGVIGDFTYLGCGAVTVTSVSPGSGPLAGGGHVTIGGCGFIGVDSNPSLYGVRFGGVPATITGTPTDTSVTVTVPAAAVAGLVEVTVTSPQGSNDPAGPQNDYTYTAGSPPPTNSNTRTLAMLARGD